MITLCTTHSQIVFCMRTLRNYCMKCMYIWHVHRYFQTTLGKEKKNHFTSNKCMNMSIFPNPLNKAIYPVPIILHTDSSYWFLRTFCILWTYTLCQLWMMVALIPEGREKKNWTLLRAPVSVLLEAGIFREIWPSFCRAETQGWEQLSVFYILGWWGVEGWVAVS